MRNYILGLTVAAFFSGVGYADDPKPYVQHCKLASEKGPFESFDVTYQVGGGKLLSKQVTLKTVNISSVSKNKETEAKIRLSVRSSRFSNVSFSLQDDDFSLTRFDLGSDDDGVGAFVAFASDGPNIRAFYRCDEYPETKEFE